MEEYQKSKSHKLSLDSRSCGILTGVKEVVSFDTDLIMLETEKGMLEIKGIDLHVTRLDVDKGELEIEGTVNSLIYSEVKSAAKISAGIIGRLFK